MLTGLTKAIAEFLWRRKKGRKHRGFGAWKRIAGAPKDGLEYQIEMRREWD